VLSVEEIQQTVALILRCINAYEEVTQTSWLLELNVTELNDMIRLWMTGIEERTGLLPHPRMNKVISLSRQSVVILRL